MRYNNSMLEPARPDPDQLLAELKAEEEQSKRGRLKIFLGYVAGVGKTYAMLEAAHQRLSEGLDVVVAYVETHGRKDTEKLLEGLQVLPRSSLQYRGVTLAEMDLDAILVRRPRIALVDELAHSNAPGSRHPKRYQDVEELLAAGIDVYTTVNIQHLESLKDAVQQITGVQVHETVPDKIFDEAYEIELVDLPADELLQRLKDGKVYIPDQAARAIEKFFRKGNLTALRELSMRRAAERVDTQMRSYMEARAIPGPWPARDRILVSLSSHPLGERLIRAGRRLADDLNAEWFVLFVETPGHTHMPPENRERMQHNLDLAEALGAQIFHVAGQSVADEILLFCRQHNITKIIAGKPLRPRWREVFQPSVIDEIIRKSGRVDVYVVSAEAGKLERFPVRTWLPHRPLGRYLASLGLVILATLAILEIHTHLDPTNLVMIFLAAVVIAAVFLGRGPSIVASFLSVLAFDFFLVNPRFSFAVTDTQYILTFFGLLIVGLIISNSASLLRDQVEALRKRESQAQALNRFSQELTGAVTLDQVLDIVIRNTGTMFDRAVVVLLPERGRLVPKAASQAFTLNESELAVAEWAFKNGIPAGRGTDTLPAAEVRYSPLITARGVIGVMGFKPIEPKDYLSQDQRQLFSGFNNLSALAIERARFAEDSVQAEMLRSTERLQSALLNSISHQLRTPLATIQGVLTSLSESEKSPSGENRLDPQTRVELIETATGQTNQLNRLVENLLDMTRLEAGAVRVHCEPGDLTDLVGAVVGQMAHLLEHRPVEINIPADIPSVSMDAGLSGQILVNLLENACKYSPTGSPITISARAGQNHVEVSVRDHGIGIPEEDLARVFDKFYRVERPQQVTGTGLGLSICKGIVEAQGGKIWARNNPDGGVTMAFTLLLHCKE
jgi:two-component system, OmpR family, sensor histidine kinase KdpD